MLHMIKDESKLLCYDIESYYDDFILTFADVNLNRAFEFVNSYVCNITGRSLASVVEEHILAAYNGYQYDDLMLTYMLDYEPLPRAVRLYNDELFLKDDREKQFSPVHKSIKSIDLMQQINTSINGKGGRSLFSLKHIMANVGLEIHESGVGFEGQRKLTPEELEAEVEYCWNDTIVAFEHVYKTKTRRGYFLGKSGIVDMIIDADWTFYKPGSYWFLMRLTEGSLVAQLFKGIKPTPIDWDFQVPRDCLEIWRKNWYKEGERPAYHGTIADNDIVLGYGGAHGTHNRLQEFTNLFHIDVQSMYPTTAENYRILGPHTEYYGKMKLERVSIKKSDPLKADAQKRVLNTTYGKLLEKGGKMANIPGGITICFRGQEAIYNLVLRLQEYGTIAQINTDGIYFKPKSYTAEFEQRWRNELEFWEEDFDMKLDVEFYKKLIQRDVNLYIAVDEDDHIKAKGLLNNYKLDNEQGLTSTNHKPYDNPIVYKAVVEYMLNGVPILDTIMNKNNPLRYYQTIYQANRAFPYICKGKHIDGREKQKVNRIINVNDGYDLQKAKYYDEEYRTFTSAKQKYAIGDKHIIRKTVSTGLGLIKRIEDGVIYTDSGFVEIKNKHKEIVECRHKIGDEYKGKVIANYDEESCKLTFVDGSVSNKLVKNDKNFILEFTKKPGDLIELEGKTENEYEIVKEEEVDGKFLYTYVIPEGYRFFKVTNCSNSAMIVNDDIRDATAGDYDINYGFYAALAYDFLNKFYKRRG